MSGLPPVRDVAIPGRAGTTGTPSSDFAPRSRMRAQDPDTALTGGRLRAARFLLGSRRYAPQNRESLLSLCHGAHPDHLRPTGF